MTYHENVLSEAWRHDAMVARRIIKALPDCLTKQAIQDIDLHLACQLNDDQAVTEFRELVGRQPCPCGAEGCTNADNTLCFSHLVHEPGEDVLLICGECFHVYDANDDLPESMLSCLYCTHDF